MYRKRNIKEYTEEEAHHERHHAFATKSADDLPERKYPDHSANTLASHVDSIDCLTACPSTIISPLRQICVRWPRMTACGGRLMLRYRRLGIASFPVEDVRV